MLRQQRRSLISTYLAIVLVAVATGAAISYAVLIRAQGEPPKGALFVHQSSLAALAHI